MDTLLQDLRYGTRMLRRSPGFTLVAVLALALGIGATTAIFSIVDAVLLAPLPYPEPERLLVVHGVGPRGGDNAPQSYPDFADYRERARSFEGLAAVSTETFTLTGEGEPEQVFAGAGSAELFRVLGVRPARGRSFVEGEDGPGGGARVALLSHGFWQRRFGARADVLGETLTLDGRPHEVVGVLPASFRFLIPGEIWVPLVPSREDAEERGRKYLTIVGRLRPEVSLQHARSELRAITRDLAREFPDTNDRWGVNPVRLVETITGPSRPLLLVLLAATVSVLLIACANVAGLLLVRASTRRREMALRAAVGARGRRIVRQVLTESVLLAAVGGALGIALAFAGLSALLSVLPAGLPRLDEVRLDGAVLAFAVLVSVATGVLFGVAPALQARSEPLEALKESSRATVGPARARARAGFIVAQVALALVLTVGATLFLRSLTGLLTADPGFRTENVLLVDLPRAGGLEGDPSRHVAFYREALERVSSLPGVGAAGLALSPPLGAVGAFLGFEVEGREAASPGDAPMARMNGISPGYLDAMGMRVVRGRDVAASDDAAVPRVALVNETLARRVWPGEDPLGKRITMGGPRGREAPAITVVGVVSDARNQGLHAEPGPELFLPYAQEAWPFLTLVIWTAADARELLPAVRREIRGVDPGQPVGQARTMDEGIASMVGPPRARALLVGSFAIVALGLAALGIGGLVAYSVVQRTQEIGLRMALGARRGQILRLVALEGVKLAALGIAVGLSGALLAARLAAAKIGVPAVGEPSPFGRQPTDLLLGVSAVDPAAFAGGVLALTVVALLAAWIPARKAAAVDPLVALRAE